MGPRDREGIMKSKYAILAALFLGCGDDPVPLLPGETTPIQEITQCKTDEYSLGLGDHREHSYDGMNHRLRLTKVGYNAEDQLRVRFHIHTRTSSAVPFEGFGRESSDLGIGDTELLNPGTLEVTGADYEGIDLDNRVKYCMRE